MTTEAQLSAALRRALPDSAPPPGASRRHRQLLDRARSSPGCRATLVGAVAACAATVVLVVILWSSRGQSSRTHTPAPAAATFAELAPGVLALGSENGAVSLVRDDDEMTIARVARGGAIFCVAARGPNRPFVVQVDDVVVDVVGTTFSVGRGAGDQVAVVVYEGVVRVTAGDRTSALRAGDIWTRPHAVEPAPAFAPDASPPPPPPSRPAVASPPATRAPRPDPYARARQLERAGKLAAARRAYRVLADDGPRAEDALYALARIDASADTGPLEEYRRRFPDGRYIRAVDVHLLNAAIAAADPERIEREADRFLADHPDDPRAARFRRARAAVRANRGDCASALADLEHLPEPGAARAIRAACATR